MDLALIPLITGKQAHGSRLVSRARWGQAATVLLETSRWATLGLVLAAACADNSGEELFSAEGTATRSTGVSSSSEASSSETGQSESVSGTTNDATSSSQDGTGPILDIGGATGEEGVEPRGCAAARRQ